ncbi:SUR7/PalI family protein [Sarocladium implicatum]|nr:SUR7/PalI family protein [Sarocladium implicatum]
MAARTAPPTRRNTAIAAAVFYFLTIPFLIMVLIGNTHINSTLNKLWFFKLDVSHIIPISVENSQLLNSVARSLGLHDFYSVGIWNYCEGYNDEGVTHCSAPEALFWFNPVAVLVSQLLAGATIALPSQVNTILTLLRVGSRVMFVFFITSIGMNFILLLLSPLAMKTRWWSLFITIFGFLSAIFVTVGAIIATAIGVAAKVALTAQDQLNIRANIGITVLVFMWLSAVFTVVAFLMHAAMGCCCRPVRANDSAQATRVSSMEEKDRHGLPNFIRRRRGGNTSSTSGGR